MANQIVYAKTKYNRRSARKVRLVVDMIRGKNAVQALDILQYTNKAATFEVRKTLASAISNATFNNNLSKKDLVVLEAYVNEAPTFKRGRAVARGRYHQIFKRNSHIIIGVGEKDSVNVVKSKSEKKVVQKEVKKSEKESSKVTKEQPKKMEAAKVKAKKVSNSKKVKK